ncbi:YybS family protein [Macrococcus capreoli]|uniref:YybS family protein n=1 Tax=Macrococcus capreoli TaxID=2982690 RepID=UPI0021D5E0E9|nr:YybS family protein [Macrococcus sp. TMW 2.2395]MCU7557936.1 YybS family protein [Macrococcus sp. TMW 2.2395]
MLKIDLSKTVIVTIIMMMITFLINIVPSLVIFIAPFLLLPTAYLYCKSRNGYYVMSVIVILVTLFLSIFTMQVMMGAIFAGYITGQLLIERASKERILYILTVFYSIYTLLSIIFLQITGFLPKVESWFKPTLKLYNEYLSTGIQDGTISQSQLEMFNLSMDAMLKQVPGIMIFMLFLLVLLQITITLPLLRNFKIATPNFRPLYSWQLPRTLLILYVVAVVIQLSIGDTDYVLLGVVINLRYVLEWLLFIQGLSLFHFFMRVRKTHPVLNVFIFFIAFIYAPITQLFGIIDLMVNLKKRIPGKKK